MSFISILNQEALFFWFAKMEENVMRDGNYERSNSTVVANSSSSLIASKSIELVSADNKQGADKCGHFSIRGYVSEIRRKDRKICWPFPTRGKHNESEEQTGVLPPLNVAEFRWWGCQNCLSNTDATVAPTEAGVVANFCSAEFKTNITCSHEIPFMSPRGDAQKLLSIFQKASKRSTVDGRKANAGTSIHVENIVGNCVQDQLNASENGNSGETLHRSKTRKVRLLTDIIQSELLGSSNKIHSTERNTNTDHIKTEGALSKATIEASSGMDAHGINNHMAVRRTDTKVTLGKKQKRKMPQDQDEGSSRISRPKEAPKNLRIIKGDADIKHTDTLIANSELAAEASILIGLHPGSKSYLGKHRDDKKDILGKKKRKVSQVEDRLSSLVPWQEGISKEVEIRRDVKIKCPGGEAIPLKSVQDLFTGEDLSSCHQSNVAAQKNERKILLGKKKTKVSQVEDGKSSLMPRQEGMTQKDQIIRRYTDKKNMGAAIMPSKSAQDPFSGKGVHCGLKNHVSAYRKAIVSKKRNNRPQVEYRGNLPEFEGGGSLMWQLKDSSDKCNYENAADGKEPPKLSSNECDQRDDNMREQAALDDIPMDIVELMARNQYERGLFYAKDATENKYCLSETSENVKGADLMDSTEALGNEMLRFLHEKKCRMQKAQSCNTRSKICTGKSVGPTKQKLDGPSHVDGKYNSTHFNISQLDQAEASMGFTAFSKSRENLSRKVQFPATGSRRNCGTQNCIWNGDVMGHRCFGTSVQPLQAHHTCQTVLQQSSFAELQHVRSSMIPNPIPFGINGPQKFVTESNNVNMLSPDPPDLLLKGNVDRDHGLKPMNLSATHLRKKKGSFNMETNERTHPKYPFSCTEKRNEYHPKMVGPLDMYTNETIPAMHLLRLMDAGACSSTPTNVNDNSDKFPKEHPFSHDLLTKELSGLKVGVSITSGSSANPPSCDYLDKNHLLGKSCEHLSPVPMVNTVGSSLQNDGYFQRATGFSEKTLSRRLKYQEREKTKRSYSYSKTRGPRSHKSASRNGSSSKIHEYIPIHDLQKGFLSASDIMRFPEQSQIVEDLTKRVELEVKKKDETVSPMGGFSATEICTVNRNPADFSVPGAGNVYMIGGKDLKYRKMISSRDRAALISMDGHKRQRMMKLTAIQEHVRF